MSDQPTNDTSALPDRLPAIFAFQPTYFETLTSERLDVWERAMVEYVGLGRAFDVMTLKAAAGSSTLSWCGGQTPEAGNFPDDCDQLQV